MRNDKSGSAERKTKYLMCPRVITALAAMKISEDEFVKVYDALPDLRVKIPTAERGESRLEVRGDRTFRQRGRSIAGSVPGGQGSARRSDACQ
jgi:hypothetical protein